MKPIKITTEFITLQQLLKMENFISSGGESKIFLAEQPVYVNGALEARRGRKLYPSDKILIQKKEFVIE